jgi:hypothetical protein
MSKRKDRTVPGNSKHFFRTGLGFSALEQHHPRGKIVLMVPGR